MVPGCAVVGTYYTLLDIWKLGGRVEHENGDLEHVTDTLIDQRPAGLSILDRQPTQGYRQE